METVDLTKIKMSPMDMESLSLREKLLAEGNFDHELLKYARQFAEADLVVMAAPFWDLSIPAQLKIYIENVSVGGITFAYNEQGMVGLCKAENLVFVTTRGGIYRDDPLECGSAYIKAISKLFGIDNYHCICAEGLDIIGFDVEALLGEAKREAAVLAEGLQ